MAKYLILIYEDEAAWASAGPEVLNQVLGDHRMFTEANRAVVHGGEPLEPAATATSLRRDSSGSFVITDGAFAETKEALGGYYLIEAADLDEALALARQVPAPFGGVEVRPVRTFG
ncbi:YciI family protein [Frankia sp. Cr1]|uniref:YciI family protein n=1 Tax=Frankia sp. Cr1 TaxID=3073931 RepID=UPI002AD2A1B6|nr:YciI family protein [Frankia sp. Cr1]